LSARAVLNVSRQLLYESATSPEDAEQIDAFLRGPHRWRETTDGPVEWAEEAG
jgi:hypothetical protein